MKELTVHDLNIVFEQDIRMAMYTLERYGIEANFALVACGDNDIDKANIIESLRQSDIAKKVNEHYIAILFTFVDHHGARCALQKVIDRYQQYNLKGSLIFLKKGETSEGIFERLLHANHCVHQDTAINLYFEFDHCNETGLTSGSAQTIQAPSL